MYLLQRGTYRFIEKILRTFIYLDNSYDSSLLPGVHAGKRIVKVDPFP